MKTSQVSLPTQTEVVQEVLIKGEFSPEEAKEIINHLFLEKINFHGVKSFSKKIRFGEEDNRSEERIIELKQSQAVLNKFIEAAREQGISVKIESSVSIELL